MRKVEAVGNEDCPVKIKLVAPQLYVLTTQTLDKVMTHCRKHVTPRSRGSVDYSSTRGIQVDVGLPDATSKNRAESPLYGELYPSESPA